MNRSRFLRFASVLAVSALAAGSASAAPPAHTTVRPGGAGPRPGSPTPAPGGGYRPNYSPAPYNSGPRIVIGVGIGSGYGYGSPYNSFYSGGVPYNSLGYGYPSQFRGSNYGSLGVPAIPGIYYPPARLDPNFPGFPTEPLDNPPTPLPLPLPPGTPNATTVGVAGTSAGTPATIIVVASDGAKVTFDGIDTDQTGTRHSFTTKPIAPGVEKRVSVKVDGPGGPATLTIGVRAGEKATIDMRK